MNFKELSQQIRDLTLQIKSLVDRQEIKHCLDVLIERQNLLEQLQEIFISTEKTPEYSTEFTSLLRWIQQEDAVNSAKTLQLREQSKEASVNQAKTKKALNYYKGVT